MSHQPSDHIPEALLLQWHITERCNLRCCHCYQEGQSCPDPAWSDLLFALDQYKAFIGSCREQHADRRFKAHITVTGGEPFVRGDCMELLAKLAADRLFYSFAVLSNGTMFTPGIVQSLAGLKPGFIQVSIDGTRETHDRIRGVGSYDRAVAGVKLLVHHGIPTHISFTAYRHNYRDFPHVADIGRRLGVTRVWADRMVPCGRGGLVEEGMMTSDITREFLKLMQAERRRGLLRRSRVELLRSLQFIVSGGRPYRCSAGDGLVTIMPNGDVYPCRRMPFVAGNIFRQNMLTIYRTSELFHSLRDRERIAKGCEACFYSRTCNGGSRCLAAAVYGDPFHADPGCWLADHGPLDERGRGNAQGTTCYGTGRSDLFSQRGGMHAAIDTGVRYPGGSRPFCAGGS